MSLPRLTRQVVLEHPEKVSDNAGGYSVSWVALGMHWAEIRPGSGRERAESGLPQSRLPMRITVRGAPIASDRRPVPGQRFRQGTRVFHIEAVSETDPDGRYLLCRAVEEVAS